MVDERWIADGCAEAQRAISAGHPREASKILRGMADEVRRRHRVRGGRKPGQVAAESMTARVLGVVRMEPRGMGSPRIGRALGLTPRQVQYATGALVRMGHIESVRRGFFRVKGTP